MITRPLLILLAIAQPSLADEPPRTDANRKLMMMVETNVIPGKKLKGPPEGYKADGDPHTIELVFLRPADGPSRVSEDGEVIFQQGRATEAEIDALLEQAFDNRLKREKAAETSAQ